MLSQQLLMAICMTGRTKERNKSGNFQRDGLWNSDHTQLNCVCQACDWVACWNELMGKVAVKARIGNRFGDRWVVQLLLVVELMPAWVATRSPMALLSVVAGLQVLATAMC